MSQTVTKSRVTDVVMFFVSHLFIRNQFHRHSGRVSALEAASDTGGDGSCYRYEVSTTWTLTWETGREYCQSLGGDLAYHGMDDIEIRE